MEIVEFLRARLDEREAAARAAGGGSWVAGPRGHGSYAVACDGDPVVYDEGSPTDEQAEHIALNDPAYVLADIAAKRRIVDECAWTVKAAVATSAVAGLAEHVLKGLAAPFAGHPDFDPAWKAGLPVS